MAGAKWWDTIWNPATGCSEVSPGCRHCYARRFAKRLAGRAGYPTVAPFRPQVRRGRLPDPFRWKRRSRVAFTCSMGDLFHEAIPDSFRRVVFGVMASAGAHTFIVLTKRPRIAAEFFADDGNNLGQCLFALHGWRMRDGRWLRAVREATVLEGRADTLSGWTRAGYGTGGGWPLPNVWLGVSAENQRAFDLRWPIIARVPAWRRVVSLEPLLEPIEFNTEPGATMYRARPMPDARGPDRDIPLPMPNWVLAGAETGPGRRAFSPSYLYPAAKWCAATNTPFFLKSPGPFSGLLSPHNRLCSIFGGAVDAIRRRPAFFDGRARRKERAHGTDSATVPAV